MDDSSWACVFFLFEMACTFFFRKHLFLRNSFCRSSFLGNIFFFFPSLCGTNMKPCLPLGHLSIVSFCVRRTCRLNDETTSQRQMKSGYCVAYLVLAYSILSMPWYLIFYTHMYMSGHMQPGSVTTLLMIWIDVSNVGVVIHNNNHWETDAFKIVNVLPIEKWALFFLGRRKLTFAVPLLHVILALMKHEWMKWLDRRGMSHDVGQDSQEAKWWPWENALVKKMISTTQILLTLKGFQGFNFGNTPRKAAL